MFIIISRGWGALTLFAALAFGGLGIWLGTVISRDSTPGIQSATMALLLAGIAVTLLGLWLNQMRAAELARKFATERRVQLDQLVESGQFNLGHPWPIPTSMAMARSQADQLYAAETEAYAKAQHNRHTLYYIPMQFWGYGFLAAALVVGVASLF